MINSENVAVYRVAIQIGTISSIALISVNSIFAPLISNLYHDNKFEELKNMYKTTTMWVSIINLLVFGYILIFASDIMNLAGDEFRIGGYALIIVSLGQVMNSCVGSVGLLNSMTSRPKAEFCSGLIAFVMNILLNALLIPIYGITGAAIASMIALASRNIVNFIFIYRHLHIHPYNKNYIKLIGVFVLSTLLIYFVSMLFDGHYLVRLLCCGIIYVGIFGSLTYKILLSNDEKEKILKYSRSKINK